MCNNEYKYIFNVLRDLHKLWGAGRIFFVSQKNTEFEYIDYGWNKMEWYSSWNVYFLYCGDFRWGKCQMPTDQVGWPLLENERPDLFGVLWVGFTFIGKTVTYSLFVFLQGHTAHSTWHSKQCSTSTRYKMESNFSSFCADQTIISGNVFNLISLCCSGIWYSPIEEAEVKMMVQCKTNQTEHKISPNKFLGVLMRSGGSAGLTEILHVIIISKSKASQENLSFTVHYMHAAFQHDLQQ